MQRQIPLATLLRFPIIFGTLLIAGGAAFKYREMFLGNIEERRSSLLIENAEDRKLLDQKKIEMMKK